MDKKFSICLECFSRGVRFKPTTDEERKKHNREEHKTTNGKSNTGNANRVKRGAIRTDLFRPKRHENNNFLFVE